jgi:hypothetical protein
MGLPLKATSLPPLISLWSCNYSLDGYIGYHYSELNFLKITAKSSSIFRFAFPIWLFCGLRQKRMDNWHVAKFFLGKI